MESTKNKIFLSIDSLKNKLEKKIITPNDFYNDLNHLMEAYEII